MPTITLPGDYQPSVKDLLKAPTRLAGRVIDTEQQFLSEYLYRGPVPTQSGVVEYQVATLDTEYAARGDVKNIQPMSKYPMLDVAGEESTFGGTTKYGAGFKVSYEAVDRNDINPILKGTRFIRNHIVRLDANRSLAAIDAAVDANGQAVPATGGWGAEGRAFNDLSTALVAAPAGYSYDTLLLNKQDAFRLSMAPDIKSATMYTDTRATAGVYNSVLSNINGLLGLNVVVNDFVPVGKAYLVERNTAGFVALEKDFELRILDQPESDHWLVQGSKRSAPFVDEPAAVQVITGIDAA